MGHERIGVLPRSLKWDNVRIELSQYNPTIDNTQLIAHNTIKNVRTRFENLINENGSLKALKYILTISYTYKKEILDNQDNLIQRNSSPIKLSRGFDEFAKGSFSSSEYEVLIKNSLSSALVKYFSTHNILQENLFQTTSSNDVIWQKLNNAKGFCEITRYYFANLTENYLKYFLDREASAHIKDFNIRQKLSDSISLHSFETARIVQSFAAGWYNKNAKDKIPSDSQIKKFLSFASSKIKSELLREENN